MTETVDKLWDSWYNSRECHVVGPDDLIGSEVRAHWHFQKKKYSVSLRASNGRWYVVRHRETGEQLLLGKLTLQNVHFKVEPAGARKAYETGKRNVHAYVQGTVLRAEEERSRAVAPCGSLVFYSPFIYAEPEFKVVWEDFGTQTREMVGIRSSNLLTCGCDPILHIPNMIAAGNLSISKEV